MVKCLPTTCKAQGSIPNTTGIKKKMGTRGREGGEGGKEGENEIKERVNHVLQSNEWS